jgi:hypothetical protein
MFSVLFLSAKHATRNDPMILRVVLNSSRFKAQYDPQKRLAYTVKAVRKWSASNRSLKTTRMPVR